MKLWIAALLLTVTQAAPAQNLEIVGPQKSARLSLRELKRKLKTQTVRIEDKVYKKTMTFDGFPLLEVLALAGLGPEGSADELVFTALDGYSPNMSFSALKNQKGYLVYQEHGSAGKFALVEQGKAKVSPGPFYVVWDGGENLPWAYQLAKIEAVSWSAKYPRVIPPKVAVESDEMKGFVLFKSECIRCHSINLQGGDVGPELNAPQNVTEYWRAEVLKDFIRDAPGFRYKSKMPSFTSLKSEQIAQLVAYLTHMKNFKIQSANP